MRRRGFTLLEVSIAMALGLIIILTLLAVLRTTSATVNASRRLAIENGLMRAGLIAALEEVDWWGSYDDPDDATLQGLRACDDQVLAQNRRSQWETGSLRGLPFTPFRTMAPVVDFVTPTLLFTPSGASRVEADALVEARAAITTSVNAGGSASAADAPDWPGCGTVPGPAPWPTPLAPPTTALPIAQPVVDAEYARGWRPDYHWAAADERTWFSGNGGETLNGDGSGSTPVVSAVMRSDKRCGRYAIFESPKAAPMLGDSGPNPAETIVGTGTGPYGQIESRHSWRPATLYGLRHALGYYGFCEYLPANQILCAYGWARKDASGWADIDEAFHAGWSRFPSNPDSGQSGLRYAPFPTTLYHPTRNLSLTLFARSPYAFTSSQGTTTTASLPLASFAGSGGGWNGNYTRGLACGTGQNPDLAAAVYFEDWFDAACVTRALMRTRPAEWPEVTLSIGRWVTSAHFYATAGARWVSPVSGAISELTVNGYGTSLRGARQQRGRSGGWARWYAPAADLTRIAAEGLWYDRVVDLPSGTVRYVLKASAACIAPAPRPPVVPAANDPTLDDQ